MFDLIPLSKLQLSASNVRKTLDPAADVQLSHDIEARGLLQNLIVTKARKRGHFDVNARRSWVSLAGSPLDPTKERTTMNTVNLAGRVAKDPEVRNTVTTLIVATDRVKLKDGKTYIDEDTGYTAKETEFHKVTCFNGLGKAAATRDKGDPVAITGRIHYSRWTDREGNTRYGCEIIADKIDFF